jgi:hypothetical protein
VLFTVGSRAVAELAALSRAAVARISGMLTVDLAANAARGPAATLELAKELSIYPKQKQTIALMITTEGPT